mgnify:CR=1 FL=1
MKLIPLTKSLFTQVDDEDYDYLMQWKWGADKSHNTCYAVTYGYCNNHKIRMHRLLLKLTNPTILGDHKDRDGLNNQRFNLRVATNSQNQMNKQASGYSNYLGVYLHKNTITNMTKKGIKTYKYLNWKATISVNKKAKHLGYFKLEEDAARAYDRAAVMYHGEYANLNFK